MKTPLTGSRGLVGATLALGLTVFGARLWLVHRYGSAMPFFDQWDAEGWALLKPWQEGRLTWAAMVAPHLEHRIFWTRAMVLGLFELNGGQWDGKVEMVAGAALFTAVLTAVTLVATRSWTVAGGHGHAGLTGGMAVLGALPFGWENPLSGFASVFYFLLGFSLLALWGLGTRPVGSAGWWAGVFGAVAACFSMGSGPLAAAVAGGWVAANCLRHRARPTAGEGLTLTVCVTVVAMGLALRTEVSGHAYLHATGAAAWARALGHNLAWPFSDGSPWVALVLYLPLAGLGVVWLRRRPSRAGLAGGLLPVGAWVLLQAAAMSYARGGDGQGAPPSRYLDLLAAGVAVNLLAVWLLAGLARPSNPLVVAGRQRADRALALGGAWAWTLFLAAGLTRLTIHDFRADLPSRRENLRQGVANVRAFLIGGDAAALRDKPVFNLPYPDTRALANYLLDPTLQATLPAVIRPPLDLEPETGPPFIFRPEGVFPSLRAASTPADGPAWGSGGPGQTGEFRARLRPAPRLPYLRWELAGDLGVAGADLGLRVEDVTGARAQVVQPPRPNGKNPRWRAEYAPVPAGAARVVALDRDARHGFAFRAPVEVGPLSRWVDWLLRRGLWVFGAGVLGLAWTLAAGMKVKG